MERGIEREREKERFLPREVLNNADAGYHVLWFYFFSKGHL